MSIKHKARRMAGEVYDVVMIALAHMLEEENDTILSCFGPCSSQSDIPRSDASSSS